MVFTCSIVNVNTMPVFDAGQSLSCQGRSLLFSSPSLPVSPFPSLTLEVKQSLMYLPPIRVTLLHRVLNFRFHRHFFLSVNVCDSNYSGNLSRRFIVVGELWRPRFKNLNLKVILSTKRNVSAT